MINAAAPAACQVSIEQMTGSKGVANVTVSTAAASTVYSFAYNHGPKDDYFADGTMSGNWTVLNEDKDAYSLTQGAGLVMPTQTGDIYQNSNPWHNMFVMPAQGNWEVVAKAVYPQVPTGDYQQSMAVIWQDEDNYIRINCQQSSLKVEPGVETNGTFSNTGFSQPNLKAAEDGTVTIFYKLRRDGSDYTVAVGQDGVNYTVLGTAKGLNLVDPKVGLFISQNSSVEPINMQFEYVAVTWLNGVEQKTDAQVLAWAAQNVADYIAAALPTETEENITLATAPHGYTVTLESSNPAVIAADGTVTPVVGDQNVLVTVRVSDGDTVAVSTVTVTVPGLPPELAIVSQPVDFAGAIGDTGVFAVEVNREDVTFQWMYSNNGWSWSKSSMEGCSTAALSVAMKAFRVGQLYKVIVTDSEGNSVESDVVALTVASTGLKIVTDPANVNVAVNKTASFTVKAEGEGLTYQWMYSNNGGATWSRSTAPGAATAAMSIEGKAFRNGQMYKCVVTDASGNVVESAPAAMTVG